MKCQPPKGPQGGCCDVVVCELNVGRCKLTASLQTEMPQVYKLPLFFEPFADYRSFEGLVFQFPH